MKVPDQRQKNWGGGGGGQECQEFNSTLLIKSVYTICGHLHASGKCMKTQWEEIFFNCMGLIQ